MIPRNPHIGTNSTTLSPDVFGDPAVIAEAGVTRVDDFLHSLRQRWWDLAACRGAGVADFYATDPAAKARAFTLCGRCEALGPCRAEAVADHRLDHGIRGGMDVAARKNARRNQTSDRPEQTDVS